MTGARCASRAARGRRQQTQYVLLSSSDMLGVRAYTPVTPLSESNSCPVEASSTTAGPLP